MRINIYNEELTTDIEIVMKTADTGNIFYGIRFYLKSAESLHNDKLDDDRTAVTFWADEKIKLFDLFDIARTKLNKGYRGI